MKLKIANVVGARPNFMKIAPLVDEMKKYEEIESILVHTGQHYDEGMSKFFFDDLGLPKPDIYLGVGSAGHGEQTGKIMIEFERVLQEHRPEVVIVVGDVNSTIACGLVAVKMGIRLAHVEAGLRSYDRTMPEEINRVLTDQISDYLFTTERSALRNLQREGIDQEKIFFVGNVMIDTLLKHRERAEQSRIMQELEVTAQRYGLVTLHRPSNVDAKENLAKILEALITVQQQLPLIFPVHPRTRKQLQVFGLEEKVQQARNLILTDPLGYLDFLKLMAHAKLVLTDSGGIQEETTVLGVPCITMRENTERPITVEIGTNVVIGNSPERVIEESHRILAGHGKTGKLPELWDGHAAERIVRILLEKEL
ncbi:MAG: UDP-N-acetylglucosamine 2-epimerase (non-hydrolyzing) [candidate division KSB1 bacterium]|nr:UDP-N-acetylglucosamine 2-epimerase (non-hydrolyzing) [candidate division KSB1 bacterium]MDZ7302269.1 UDP-N-acetylglucosamine 2-epimerase (non-hydrolyzing) [candidate division KSB1 bacterium]MDZ7311375.1 UDP-N-acetylglucosamine 2-epimerase (non-hydrolyzing) [candidate division KSB1 bacterium]